MGIAWSPSYELGVDVIDGQHRELLAQISALIDALQQARGQEQVEATLAFLEGYAARHFALEERLMTESAYPGRAEHLSEHAQFVRTFAALAEDVRRGGPSSALALEVNNKICQWLVRHVLGTDKPLCHFLLAARGAAPPRGATGG